MTDLEVRLRNKIRAMEVQNRAFQERIRGFVKAPLWARLVMAWKGTL